MALGHADRELAKQKAEEVALAFRTRERSPRQAITLAELFDIYAKEVTPGKSPGKQQHDLRCIEMFSRHFGSSRKPSTLNVRDWNQFVGDRRSGAVAPKHVEKRRRVRDRVIAYDLKFLLSVLNFGVRAGDGRGGTLLERNPLAGLSVPKEESPRRIVLTAEQYSSLRKIAAEVHELFDLALVLAHETGHRIGSIRLLRWSDIDFGRKTVRWRAETDKVGFEHMTPLTDVALDVLAARQKAVRAIGSTWVFPGDRRPAEAVPRSTVLKWWERAAKLAELPTMKGAGFHSLRRQFATEMKHTPLRDLAQLGGWKSPQTILSCYQQPDEATQRKALAERRELRAGGLS
jgi:integrase